MRVNKRHFDSLVLYPCASVSEKHLIMALGRQWKATYFLDIIVACELIEGETDVREHNVGDRVCAPRPVIGCNLHNVGECDIPGHRAQPPITGLGLSSPRENI